MSGHHTESDLWVRRLRSEPPASVRLFCFPFAGGSASYFRPLAALLGSGIEVLAIQYPGRQDRRGEVVVDDIQRLADQVCDAVSPWLDQPFAFFGHSMGSVVAFEVTRRLAVRHGPQPLALFASGRRAPSVHRSELTRRKNDAGRVAELRSLAGTEAAVLDDGELVQMFLPAVRGDYRAIETYRGPSANAVLDVPITVMVGDQDPRVTVAEAAAWRDHTTGDFTLQIFPGGHFCLTGAASDVASRIRTVLAACVQRPPAAGGQRPACQSAGEPGSGRAVPAGLPDRSSSRTCGLNCPDQHARTLSAPC
ncbi:thioesterase II family protein [Streptomyces sp. NPDC048448]|uniref:thioesterase II family protein n=1 Tax=Streptomyces sp. NPDC048448 TaxID=3365554 RepID=UPI003711FE4B